MIRKPLELLPAAARAFVDDIRAYLAENDAIKRDAIAVRRFHVLKEYQGPREKKPRSSDVKEMFAPMRKPPGTSCCSPRLCYPIAPILGADKWPKQNSRNQPASLIPQLTSSYCGSTQKREHRLRRSRS